MKPVYTMSVALFAGAVLGGAAMERLHAQQKPPVFVVMAYSEISDEAGLHNLTVQSTSSIADNGGRTIIRSPKPTRLSGVEPKRYAVIQFQSADKAQAWYASAEMKPLNELRDKVAKSQIFIVEGSQ